MPAAKHSVPGPGAALGLLLAALALSGCGDATELGGGVEPRAAAKRVRPAVRGDRAAELADALLRLRVRARLLEHLGSEALGLQIGVDGGQVVLSGRVSSSAGRSLASEEAIGVEGVDRVASLVEVVAREPDRRAAARHPTQRTGRGRLADELLLTRVKLRLAERIGADVLDLEVDVDGDVVELRGRLPRARQRRQALEVARAVGGVAEVRDLLDVAS